MSNIKKDEFSTRRGFLVGAAFSIAGIATLSVSNSLSFASVANQKTYSISFRNVHTGESFSGAYRIGDKYLPESFERINYIMRDFRTGDVKMMDPRLIDMLYFLRQDSSSSYPFEIISGYRSPKTNARLRRVSTGVAKKSLHMEGKAVDFRFPGVKLSKLRDKAKAMKVGGVGYYPNSGFIHIDTGNVRSW